MSKGSVRARARITIGVRARIRVGVREIGEFCIALYPAETDLAMVLSPGLAGRRVHGGQGESTQVISHRQWGKDLIAVKLVGRTGLQG